MNDITVNPEAIVNILKNTASYRTLGGITKELELPPEKIALCIINNIELFRINKSLSDSPLVYLNE